MLTGTKYTLFKISNYLRMHYTVNVQILKNVNALTNSNTMLPSQRVSFFSPTLTKLNSSFVHKKLDSMGTFTTKPSCILIFVVYYREQRERSHVFGVFMSCTEIYNIYTIIFSHNKQNKKCKQSDGKRMPVSVYPSRLIPVQPHRVHRSQNTFLSSLLCRSWQRQR